MHICEVCFLPVERHPEVCDWGPDIHFHWPALCCQGCGCRSVEEHHPEVDYSEQEEELEEAA